MRTMKTKMMETKKMKMIKSDFYFFLFMWWEERLQDKISFYLLGTRFLGTPLGFEQL